MRTKGKAIISAEITPQLKERIREYRYASNKRSNSEVVREALYEFFLNKGRLKVLEDDDNED